MTTVQGLPWNGVSLGAFMLHYSGDSNAVVHEGGHAVQSAMWGPLYLPIVLGHYLVRKIANEKTENGWVERQADKLGELYPSRSFKKRDCRRYSGRPRALYEALMDHSWYARSGSQKKKSKRISNPSVTSQN